MKRDTNLYLIDIKNAIRKIQKYAHGLSFDKFKNDDKTVDAVIRNLGIIGEAAGKLPGGLKNQYPDIPWEEIVGLRNKVIHEYFGVDIGILWATVQEDIPVLKNKLKKLPR